MLLTNVYVHLNHYVSVLQIYTMTLRLSAMFEEQIRDIISGWKQVSKGRRMSKRHTKSRYVSQ